MDMVRAVNLKKYYIADTYEVHALDGVSLTAEEGEFLAVVGTSGSGKTTLLNMLGGLDVPDSGGVWIRGSSLKDMDREERTVFRRRNIGFVFQQYNLIPSLSVYENIVLPLRLDGQGVDEDLFEEITHLLGLSDKLDRLPGTLSGGQQQRTAIARAQPGLGYRYGSDRTSEILRVPVPPDRDRGHASGGSGPDGGPDHPHFGRAYLRSRRRSRTGGPGPCVEEAIPRMTPEM